jgi:Peptidase family M28
MTNPPHRSDTEEAGRQAPDMPWVRIGSETLFLARDGGEAAAARQARTGRAGPAAVIEAGPPENRYIVTQIGRLFQRAYPDVPILHDRGRYLIVALDPERAKAIVAKPETDFVVRPLRENSVVFDVRQPPPTATRAARAAWIEALLERLERATLEAHLEHLVSFPTRFSTSGDYAAAADWALERFRTMGYEVRLEPVAMPGGTTQNVIAERAGSAPEPRGLVIVTAHLDSINLDGATAPAPGADDNGSGSAGVLAIAHALAEHAAAHDLRLILFGGEEEGLFGSTAYVADLDATDRERLRAVVNMDMIGTLNTPQPAVLLESAEAARPLVEGLAAAAATYTGLTVQESFNPFGSDHLPFLDAGLPAVLTIEGTDDANPHEHTAGDTLEHINYELMLEILRMNVAFVATMMGRSG